MRQRVFALVICLQIVMFGAMGIAVAEEVGDIYGGVSYSKTIAKYSSPVSQGTYKPMTFGVGLSVVAMPYLALDGYVFTGVEDSSNDLPLRRTMTVSAKDGYGFNLRPFLPLSKSWSLYAKLGRQYGGQETVVKNQVATLVTINTSYAHTVYGLGVGYNINERWGVGLDYMKAKRIASENIDTSLISLGLRYKF
jgi:opacity protein-like surface antigen